MPKPHQADSIFWHQISSQRLCLSLGHATTILPATQLHHRTTTAPQQHHNPCAAFNHWQSWPVGSGDACQASRIDASFAHADRGFHRHFEEEANSLWMPWMLWSPSTPCNRSKSHKPASLASPAAQRTQPSLPPRKAKGTEVTLGLVFGTLLFTLIHVSLLSVSLSLSSPKARATRLAPRRRRRSLYRQTTPGVFSSSDTLPSLPPSSLILAFVCLVLLEQSAWVTWAQ